MKGYSNKASCIVIVVIAAFLPFRREKLICSDFTFVKSLTSTNYVLPVSFVGGKSIMAVEPIGLMNSYRFAGKQFLFWRFTHFMRPSTSIPHILCSFALNLVPCTNSSS